MVLKDLLVTPIIMILLYVVAYLVRPKVTNRLTRKYFIPALTLKFIGALSIGFLYQFYYGGGDTFGYTTYGGSYIWNAFLENPIVAYKLIFFDNTIAPDTYKYAQYMWYFDDAPAYFVVRLAGIFSIITLNTYSSIALLFGVVGFSGLWAFYSSMVKLYPTLARQLAIAFFAIPSVIFWGSGVMKDTLTISAVCWVSFCIIQLFIFKRNSVLYTILILFFLWVIYVIKIYILICLLPTLIIWIYAIYFNKIKPPMLRYILQPVVFVVPLLLSIYGLLAITGENEKYSFDAILSTAEITARDNSMWTVRAEGSGYSLGDYDFTTGGLAKNFFPAVWVTLFRPYLWEVNSIVMLLSAIESFILLLFTISLVLKSGVFNFLKYIRSKPIIIMSLVFTLSFAFAIGVSSGNFGSLVRYKIPIMPFFITALILISYYSKRDKKLVEFDLTE